jgi:predicted dehydrogenase
VRGRGRGHVSGFAAIENVEVAAVCDVDRRVLPSAAELAAERGGQKARGVQDLRAVIDDKSIDAISIATPDHWHALATIWACRAGKDVYVEKPCSHNIREGRLMVEAARKYKRIVQHGTQSRSGETHLSALEFLKSKPLGEIRVAKVINNQLRANIGKEKDAAAPAEVDYGLWLGPARERPFNPNRFHYNWHWNWDYGTGDIGNDGVHALDYARWLLGVEDPVAVSASGAKLHFDDDQETPDTQTVTFEFPGKHLIYEMRIWTPYHEHGMENGAVLYGENGCMELSPQGWRVTFKDNKPGPQGAPSRRGEAHFKNFIDCVRSRAVPNAEILEGHLSSRLAHLGNIATRVGRRLLFDAETESFRNDAEANRLLSREYREPFVVPDPV